MDAFTKALLKNYVRSITFESNVNDPITIRDPFAESPPGISDAAISALRPKFTFELWEQKPFSVAPAGEPDREKRTQIKIGGVLMGVVGGGILLALLTRKR